MNYIVELRDITALLMLLTVLTFAAGCKSSGSEEEPQPEEEQTEESASPAQDTPGSSAACVSRVQEVVQELNQWRQPGIPIRPGIPLPQAQGDRPTSDIVVVASSDFVHIVSGFETYSLSADTGESLVSDSYVADVKKKAIARLQSIVAHEQEMAAHLKSPEPVALSIAAEPSVPVSAVVELVSDLPGTRLYALVDDPDAPPPFERSVVQEMKALFEQGVSEDTDRAKEATVDEIMSRVSDSCTFDGVRDALRQRFGLSLRKQDKLSGPFPAEVEKCGCASVDVDVLEAVLHWAYEPQDPGLRIVPIDLGKAPSNPSETWGDWLTNQSD